MSELDKLPPCELVRRLVTNFDSQRKLAEHLDVLENESIELREALAPAFSGWQIERVLCCHKWPPRLVHVSKRLNGGIDVLFHEVTPDVDLRFPDPRPEPTSSPQGPSPDVHLLDAETS